MDNIQINIPFQLYCTQFRSCQLVFNHEGWQVYVADNNTAIVHKAGCDKIGIYAFSDYSAFYNIIMLKWQSTKLPMDWGHTEDSIDNFFPIHTEHIRHIESITLDYGDESFMNLGGDFSVNLSADFYAEGVDYSLNGDPRFIEGTNRASIPTFEKFTGTSDSDK